ncbi:hypothetical protein HJA89_16335 [Rhizobium bangladeshense]|uniref:hypothetical protein n=1 Tax=Rhizobium bangladeshense TaxID=1138189 RepID=UPI001C83890E|nr:hypothetical protein [Rhizobium bangladeshense]MBX4874443.1 hypothetical protein [Rhizobium bangladeshense]
MTTTSKIAGATLVIDNEGERIEGSATNRRGPPMPLSDISGHLRTRHQSSPTLQKLADQNRQQREEYRAVARGLIEGFQQQMAAAFKVDPRVFGQVPDFVVDQILATGTAAKSLVAIPGAQVNVTFTSEVTVNGVQLPDDREI